MLLDLRNIDDKAHFQAPICIVGAGVAGLTLTRRLLSSGWPVLLVESGGLDFEAPIQALAGGRVLGQPYYDLDKVSLRMLGGSTAIWGGRCAELDPVDFETRPWLPHSGWPFAHDALQPYYAEALRLFEVNAPEQARVGWHSAHAHAAALDGGELEMGFWSIDGVADRFTAPRIGDVLRHPGCRVLMHATATELSLAPDAGSVKAITVRDISGKSAVIEAEHVVLALGGIETPRLLLASNDIAAAGIGNAHDLVGRFFMEHPHARGGAISGPGMWQLLRALGRRQTIGGTRHAALLRLSPDAQRRLGALNTALSLGLRQPEAARQAWVARTYGKLKHDLNATATNRRLWRTTKHAARRLNDLLFPIRPWFHVRSGRGEIAAIVRAEQAPNPDSRVLLGAETDALGLRRADLDWRLSAVDKHSVGCLIDSLDAVMRRSGLGSVRKAAWLSEPGVLWHNDPTISAHPIGGYHHMGTTRMADDPTRGVVDRHGRVHGIANLHVAGSSVFPTSSWANPTLTIAALALRMGDRFGRFAD